MPLSATLPTQKKIKIEDREELEPSRTGIAEFDGYSYPQPSLVFVTYVFCFASTTPPLRSSLYFIGLYLCCSIVRACLIRGSWILGLADNAKMLNSGTYYSLRKNKMHKILLPGVEPDCLEKTISNMDCGSSF